MQIFLHFLAYPRKKILVFFFFLFQKLTGFCIQISFLFFFTTELQYVIFMTVIKLQS
uniref:Uncharacterized protein n=1 Tax=Manihot esculenta TaxID=3983 RepID=A0A2C9VYP1_MANES